MLQRKRYQPEMHKFMRSYPHLRFQLASKKKDIFLCLTYLKKTPTKLTRNVCEFQAAYLWGMYHCITAVV